VLPPGAVRAAFVASESYANRSSARGSGATGNIDLGPGDRMVLPPHTPMRQPSAPRASGASKHLATVNIAEPGAAAEAGVVPIGIFRTTGWPLPSSGREGAGRDAR
jgi:hypothetical protein